MSHATALLNPRQMLRHEKCYKLKPDLFYACFLKTVTLI